MTDAAVPEKATQAPIFELNKGAAGLIRAVIKLIGLKPEMVEMQISDLLKIVLNVDQRLTKIEKAAIENSRILAEIQTHLGIGALKNGGPKTKEVGAIERPVSDHVERDAEASLHGNSDST